jgi:hypothetical protein
MNHGLFTLGTAALVTLVAGTDAEPIELEPTWSVDYSGTDVRPEDGRQVLSFEDGSCIVALEESTFTDSENVLIIRYAPDGTQLWLRRFNFASGVSDTFGDLVYAEQGGCWLSMRVRSSEEVRIRVVRLNGDGDVVADSDFAVDSGPLFDASVVPVIEASGPGVVVGFGASGGYHARKLDADASTVWTQTWSSGLPDGDNVTDIDIGPDGRIYLAGWTNQLFGPYATVALSPGGAFEWAHLLDGPIGSVFTDPELRVHPDGGVVVAASPETVCGVFEFRTWRIADDGLLMWDRRYDGTDCAGARPFGLAVAPDGRIAVTGTPPFPLEQGFMTVLYDADGAVLWEAHTPNMQGFQDTPYDIEFDPWSGVVLTGMSQESASLDARGVLRYDSFGELSWFWTPGESVNAGRGLSVSINEAGRIVVTGSGFGGSGVGGLASTQAFDPPEARVECRADADGSGTVDLADLNAVLGAFGQPVPIGGGGDIDASGLVDLSDLNAVLGAFGMTCER